MMRYLPIVLLVAGCTFPQYAPTPEPVANKSDCQVSCSRYAQLECEEAKPTAKGASCEEVCMNAAESGIDLAKQVSCIQSSMSCSAARSCPE